MQALLLALDLQTSSASRKPQHSGYSKGRLPYPCATMPRCHAGGLSPAPPSLGAPRRSLGPARDSGASAGGGAPNAAAVAATAEAAAAAAEAAEAVAALERRTAELDAEREAGLRLQRCGSWFDWDSWLSPVPCGKAPVLS